MGRSDPLAMFSEVLVECTEAAVNIVIFWVCIYASLAGQSIRLPNTLAITEVLSLPNDQT
jgi:hypothetical protein